MREEKVIRKRDLNGIDWLIDEVHEERVKVVEVCVGCVYLRWPHQENVSFYNCQLCGEKMIDDIDKHEQECEEFDKSEWLQNLRKGRTDTLLEKVDLEANIESHSYSWPLDGHRFTIK